jgi:hypothetical protein
VITNTKRLDTRDALAEVLVILAERHGVVIDPVRAMDFADRIAVGGMREDIEHLIDLLIGELRRNDAPLT